MVRRAGLGPLTLQRLAHHSNAMPPGNAALSSAVDGLRIAFCPGLIALRQPTTRAAPTGTLWPEDRQVSTRRMMAATRVNVLAQVTLDQICNRYGSKVPAEHCALRYCEREAAISLIAAS